MTESCGRKESQEMQTTDRKSSEAEKWKKVENQIQADRNRIQKILSQHRAEQRVNAEEGREIKLMTRVSGRSVYSQGLCTRGFMFAERLKGRRVTDMAAFINCYGLTCSMNKYLSLKVLKTFDSTASVLPRRIVKFLIIHDLLHSCWVLQIYLCRLVSLRSDTGGTEGK